MATSYEAWAKFDVDAELERVDAQAQREEKHRQAQRQRCAKQSVEDAVSTSAEVLAAHAAVAALKAKARAKKQSAGVAANGDVGGVRDSFSAQQGASSYQTETDDKQEESAAERLQCQSELFKKKHELIKQIMENRRKGEAILAQEQEKESESPDARRERRALRSFENALKFALELEKIVPDLILAEREQSILRDATETHASGDSTVHDAKGSGATLVDSHHHHDEHSCGGDGLQCTHHTGSKQEDATTKKKTDKDALPKVNDLEAILKMFFKDICMGIGACHLQGNRLAAASDAFKDVLLRDDAHVSAWLERGSAFERMGANLLALLHFSRATALGPSDENAKESVERVQETLLSGLDDIMGAFSEKDRGLVSSKSFANDLFLSIVGADAIKRKIESFAQQSSLTSILNSIHLVFQEANVLMIEGFFQYAIPKYQIALGCIDFLLDEKPELYNTEEPCDLTAEIRESLYQVRQGRITCDSELCVVSLPSIFFIALHVALKVRTSCRLNIAGGYHEMQKNQLKAVEYCEKVLEHDAADAKVQAVCHFRIAQLFRSAHSYERAMDHLELSRKLLTTTPPAPEQPQQQEQRIGTLKKIGKEIDRCGFERSQHDLAYIRSLLELNAAGSSPSSSSSMSA